MATIEKRGDSYRVRYQVYENGLRVQKNKSFKRSKDAHAFATEVECNIQAGLFADAGKMTLAEYLTMYFDTYCAHMRPNSKRAAQQYMNNHIIPVIGGVRLKALTTLQI